MRLLALNSKGAGNRSLVLLSAAEAPSSVSAPRFRLDQLVAHTADMSAFGGSPVARIYTVDTDADSKVLHLALVHVENHNLDPKRPDASAASRFINETLAKGDYDTTYRAWWEHLCQSTDDEHYMPIVNTKTPTADTLLSSIWSKRGTKPTGTSHVTQRGIDRYFAVSTPEELETVLAANIPHQRAWLPQPLLETLASDFDAALATYGVPVTRMTATPSRIDITASFPPLDITTCPECASHESIWATTDGPMCRDCAAAHGIATADTYYWANHATLPGDFFADGNTRTFVSFCADNSDTSIAVLIDTDDSPELSLDESDNSHVVVNGNPTPLTLKGMLKRFAPDLMSDKGLDEHPTPDEPAVDEPLDLTITLP